GTGYGKLIAPHLIARAKAGVKVRILIDEIGSRFMKGYGALFKSLRDAGCTVQLYTPHTFKNVKGDASFNITHRKLYMGDGERAMTGGVNLQSPFESTTQDVLIRWRGPVVGDLAREFQIDWKAGGGKTFDEAITTTPRGDVDARVAVTSPAEGRYEIRDLM